ncbi:MAG TPA: DUF3857 domain-containing protein [Acidisarcina sp.]
MVTKLLSRARLGLYLTASMPVRRLLSAVLAVLCLASLPSIASAISWQQPTPEELSVTSDPRAPGAAGIYLYREEIGDDKLNFHSLYVRLKVLTEEGKKYGDVEMPVFERAHYRIADVQGRTIHSDGTVIPYTGKPMDKLVVKTKDYQYHTSVFSLPDVQVGSIIEYRYSLRYDDNYADAPTWQIQLEIPVRSSHYHFVPTTHDLVVGHGNVTDGGQLTYTYQLPPGVLVQYLASSNSYDLRLQSIPRVPSEEYMPPISSLSYMVRFYYTGVSKQEEYWKQEGKYWSKDVDRFASPDKLSDEVRKIVEPADTDAQKVSKIYDAMMTLENTSFTRMHSREEDKDQGIKIKTAADIWTQKRGNDDEITLLFIGMARAAGLRAYAMRVTSRDAQLFRASFLDMDQLDDDIAIVVVDGKEHFFDPGQRYCSFGQMNWKHTLTQGLRQTDGGTEIADSPSINYKDTSVVRFAELKMSPDGQLSGHLRVVMSGAQALKWRQSALAADEEQVKKEFQDSLQEVVPSGVELKMNHFIGLTDWRTVLMATLDVSGSMGTSTSKRLFLPSSFFEASSKPLFSLERRELPVDLHFPYLLRDTVKLKLPAQYAAESVPKDANFPLPHEAVFVESYRLNADGYTQDRQLVLANVFFDVKEYPQLRDFYQKMNAQDQQQVILKAEPQTASAPSPPQ